MPISRVRSVTVASTDVDADSLTYTYEWYRDGVFVTGAPESHQELIGHRVVSINAVPIDEVLDRVSVLFAYENESKRIGTSAWYATMLPALQGVGVIRDHHAETLTSISLGMRLFSLT